MKKKMLKSNSLRTQKGVNGLSILKKVEISTGFLHVPYKICIFAVSNNDSNINL